MNLSRTLSVAIGIGICLASVAINTASASIQGDYFCLFGTCEESPGTCTPASCGSYCSSSTTNLWCAPKPTWGCGVVGLKTCGRIKYSGTCTNGICSGGYWPEPYQSCSLQECNSNVPPP